MFLSVEVRFCLVVFRQEDFHADLLLEVRVVPQQAWVRRVEKQAPIQNPLRVRQAVLLEKSNGQERNNIGIFTVELERARVVCYLCFF